MSGGFLRLVQTEELVMRKVKLRQNMEENPLATARKRLAHIRPFNMPLKIHNHPLPVSEPLPLSAEDRASAAKISQSVLALHLGLGR